MALQLLTNENIFSMDMARVERQAALRRMSKQFGIVGRAKPPSSVWMEDVSGSDSRSVKAQLRGRFSLRALWWNIFQKVHAVMTEQGSMEHAMYDYHRAHHGVTLFFAEIVFDFKNLVHDIKTEGCMKAASAYVVGSFKANSSK